MEVEGHRIFAPMLICLTAIGIVWFLCGNLVGFVYAMILWTLSIICVLIDNAGKLDKEEEE